MVVCFIQNGFEYMEIEANLALLALAPTITTPAQPAKAPAHLPISPPPAPQEGNDVYGEYTPLSARDILTKDLEELRLTVREMKERGGAGAGEEEGAEEEQEEQEDFLAGGGWRWGRQRVVRAVWRVQGLGQWVGCAAACRRAPLQRACQRPTGWQVPAGTPLRLPRPLPAEHYWRNQLAVYTAPSSPNQLLPCPALPVQ